MTRDAKDPLAPNQFPIPNLRKTRLRRTRWHGLLWCALAAVAEAQDPVGGGAQEPTVIASASPVMRRAYARAQATLDGFLQLAATRKPGTSSHALKVAISDGGAIEYLWVEPFGRRGDEFNGVLKDKPAILRKHRIGDRIRFTRAQIVDWMYIEGWPPRVHGNFTTCAQLSEEAAEDAEEFMRQSGLRCEEPNH